MASMPRAHVHMQGNRFRGQDDGSLWSNLRDHWAADAEIASRDTCKKNIGVGCSAAMEAASLSQPKKVMDGKGPDHQSNRSSKKQ